MSVAALRSRFSTHQSANFGATRRDAGLLAPKFVVCRSWTSSPRRSALLLGHQNPSPVGFAHPSHLLGAALRVSFAPAGRHRGHVLTGDMP